MAAYIPMGMSNEDLLFQLFTPRERTQTLSSALGNPPIRLSRLCGRPWGYSRPWHGCYNMHMHHHRPPVGFGGYGRGRYLFGGRPRAIAPVRSPAGRVRRLGLSHGNAEQYVGRYSPRLT